MNDDPRTMKILAVYAHPGDLACEGSGTLALHAERGDDVHCLVLSDGERHHNDIVHRELDKPASERNEFILGMDVDDIKTLKQAETEGMCAALGIGGLTMFGWPDVLWQCAHERVQEIAQVIRKIKPDVILGHMPWGEFQSQLTDVHAIAGHMTRMAARYCSDSLPQIDGLEPHHTKAIFWFPMMGASDTAFRMGTGIVCDIWIDITTVIEKKCNAIDLLVSQGYQGQAARKILESREGRWGMLCGCSYAEPWMWDKAPRYGMLPVRPGDLDKRYTPNDLPGDLMLCRDIPVHTPQAGAG